MRVQRYTLAFEVQSLGKKLFLNLVLGAFKLLNLLPNRRGEKIEWLG